MQDSRRAVLKIESQKCKAKADPWNIFVMEKGIGAMSSDPKLPYSVMRDCTTNVEGFVRGET